MLLSARSRFGSWVVRILFGLLVVSFGFWGIQDFLRMGKTRPVAEVGNIKISAREYAFEFDRSVQRMRNAFGPDFDIAKARKFGLDRQVLSQMISRALFDMEGSRLGLTVSDAQVADAIRANPIFQDETGRFNRIRFEELLRSNNLTEQAFTDMMRGDLERRQLVLSVASAVSTPEPFTQALYAYRNERRVARFVSVPLSAARDVLPPNEAELRAYYDAHKADFARPEYRRITYFTIRPEDLASKIQISDADLRQAYENRKSSFTKPEGRDFQQWLFRTREQAESALAKLRSGPNAQFAESTPGLVGSTQVKGAASEELLPEIAPAVFAAKPGDVVGPINSPLGWALIRVTGSTPGQIRSFEEVRDALRKTLASEQAGDKLYEMANQIQDQQAGGATIEEIAKTLGVPVHTIDGVDHSGKARNGAPVADLPNSPKFLDSAFEADVKQDVDPLELPGGGYLVLRVDAVTPAETPPFDQVKDQVVQHWQADARREGARKLAETLAQRARQGTDLAALAKEIGQPVREFGPVARDTKDETVSPQFVQALFDARQGGIFTAPAADQGFVVAQASQILPADAAIHPDAVQAVRQNLAAAMTEDVLRQYQVALEKRFGVRVNSQAVEAAIGQGQD